jgi:hypothetical protein
MQEYRISPIVFNYDSINSVFEADMFALCRKSERLGGRDLRSSSGSRTRRVGHPSSAVACYGGWTAPT